MLSILTFLHYFPPLILLLIKYSLFINYCFSSWMFHQNSLRYFCMLCNQPLQDLIRNFDMAHLLYLQQLYAKKSMDRQRVLKDKTNVLDCYSDEQMRERFRFSRGSFIKLVDLLKPELESKTNRNFDYPPEFQLLIALRYFSTGSMQRVISDTFNEKKASQSSVSRIIHKVSTVLVGLAPTVIKFPSSDEELSVLKSGFFQLYGMPGVLGCVDGTHVPLIPSAKFKPTEEYFGRKGLTINCQFICNHKLEFINAVVAHPGSAHDMRIWKESSLGKEFISGKRNGQGHLLGDSGYALRKVSAPEYKLVINFAINQRLLCKAINLPINPAANYAFGGKFRLKLRKKNSVRLDFK